MTSSFVFGGFQQRYDVILLSFSDNHSRLWVENGHDGCMNGILRVQ